MTKNLDTAKILVVEDEGIIAQDIKNCLENLGYEVPEVVYSGYDAIIKADELRPDLVLMDIVLKGDIDGIETAAEIRKRYNIPIVYLTAYEDDKTLRRAKITEPLGYILKPFEERYLKSSIEMALYKHQMENKLKDNERWLATILKSVGDGVIVVDSSLLIRYMNPVAEELTGWELSEALGVRLSEVFVIKDEITGDIIENPAMKAMEENTITGHTQNALLISKHGAEIAIDETAAPMRDDNGSISGVVLVFSDITDRKEAERSIIENEKKYRDLFNNAGEAIFVLSPLGHILSVNNAACELLGFNRDEFIEMNLINISGEEYYSKFKKETVALSSTGSVSHEGKFRKKDESFVDVEVHMSLINFLDEEVIQLFVRDITKLKETQKQINILAHAVKSISESVSITDLNDRIIYVNDAFTKTYGYKFEELKGKTLNIIRSQKNHPDIFTVIFNETLKGGWQGEIINRSREGREFPVILSTSIVKDENGEAIALIGVAMEITERKNFENALLESERDYRGLFENAHDAILIFRPDDEIILDVNQRASGIYGYSKEEFIGMTLDTLSGGNEEDRKKFREIVEKNYNARYEARHFRKDGTRMDLEINASPVNYKGQRAIVSINRDVTERNIYEKELLDSNARKSAILESSADAIITVNQNGGIVEWNISAEKMFGLKTDDSLKKNIFDFLSRDEDKEIMKKELLNLASGVKSTKLHTFSVYNLNREELSAEVSLAQINLKDNALFLLTVRDITERLMAEEALRISETRYQYVAKATNDAVWDWDLIDSTIEWNEGLNILFGYPKDFIRSDIDWWKDRIHIDDRERVITKIENTINNKEQLWYDEYRFKCANEQYAFVIDRGYLIYDLNNEPVRMIGCITDMTMRKKAEEELLEREKQYRDLTESAPIAVTRMNLVTMDYDFVNYEFVRQSGYELDEYNKLSREELINMIYPDDRYKVFNFYSEWNNEGHKGTQHIDYRIINKRGEVLWLDTYLFADFDHDGNVKAINQICIDITEQKNSQEFINKSEKRFRSLIENSSDMIALIDESLNIQFASPSTKRILKYELNEFVGRNISEFIHADDINYMEEVFADLITKPGESVNGVFRVYTKDQAVLWIEATATNLLNDSVMKSIIVNYRDITERKKAEDEIMLQKSYFQQLFENSPEAIVILNNEDKIVDINKGFERLFQFNKSEIKDCKLDDLIVPIEFKEKAVQMSMFVLRGDVIHKESVRRRKDGSTVDVSILAYPITLGKDQIGVYGIYSDISARKQTEKALKNSEERYRVFVKQSSEGIMRFEFLEPVSMDLTIDEKVEKIFKYGFLAECNDSFAKMYGYQTAEDIIGVQLSELLPHMNQNNNEFLRDFISSGYRITELESFEIDKSGNPKYFVNNLVGIIEQGYLVRAWGTIRDVTATKLAELELHKTQFRLATLLKNLPDVVLYETGGESEFITDNVINLLGYPAKNFEDRKFFSKLIHPGDLKDVAGRMQEWMNSDNNGILNLEFRCRRADGEYVWIEDHMVAIKEESGLDVLAGVMVNITERKRTEEKLKQLAEKLSASNKELEQFAYVASHDLQEPLRMVASYIQLLQRRYRSQLDNEAVEFIDFAVDGVVRMKALINDLLIYSRVNTREMPHEKVDMKSIIVKVEDNLKPSIEENNAEIKVSELPVINANNLQMIQLLQNLISNAIKFHGNEKPVVEINAKQTGSEWLFSVRDNGIGIDKEYTEKVFVIFQRLHNYKEYPGTGIGLAICKKIVEKLGGHIWVESEPGAGSTFYFTIPSQLKEQYEPKD